MPASPRAPWAVPTTDALLRRIDGLQDRPVVLAADLVLDRFIHGAPKRISREAPVLILAWEGERHVPGGGANAAANVVALGGRPLPLGVVGDDSSGRALVAALEERGIPTSGIRIRPGFKTPTKTRILGGGAVKQQIVRYDVEDWLHLEAEDLEAHRQQLEEWRRQYPELSLAVLSDYGYGAVEPALAPTLRAALGDDARLLCDSRYRLGDYTAIDAATPNQEEAEALLGGPLGSGEALDRAGANLRRRLGVELLLVTRGSRGMSLFTGGHVAHLPVHGTDQVADVTGAGDTVIGTFALALAAGGDPLEAALLANYAGGVAVMKMGTATLGADELREAVTHDATPLERLEIRSLS